MSGVPYTFASATSSIPLSELDTNFATPVTIGTTSVSLGNTVTTLANVALANVTISSVASGIPNNFLANSSVTIGNTSVSLGSTVTSLGNVTLTNVTIQGGTSNVSTNSIVNGTSNVAIASANGAVTMVTNGNTAVTIGTTGNITFGTSNAGIVFNNSSASTNSTLNDYETGTWTPTDQSGASLSLTVNGGTGIYTKIGNIVTVFFDVSYPSTGSSAGTSISLPFTVYSGSTLYQGGYCVENNASITASFQCGPGSASGSILTMTSGSTLLNSSASSHRFSFTITYRTSF